MEYCHRILQRTKISTQLVLFFIRGPAKIYLLLAFAFILMGKAVSALQEAAIISITPLPISFELNWIGVKSTWQGILAQVSVLLAFLAFKLLPWS